MNAVSSEAVSMTENTSGVNAIVQYKVPFYEAAKRYVTKPTSKGRSSRSEFWWGFLFSFVLDLGFDGLLGGTIIYNVCALVILFLDIFLWWRRMQDLGKSGWWCVVPFYNLYLAVQPSEAQENKFGSVPNTQPIPENLTLKIIITGVMAGCILSGVISGCFGGDARLSGADLERPSVTDFDTVRFDTLDELAYAAIENDIANRWDEFYRPMHLGECSLKYEGKVMGVGHRFVATFEPRGSVYYLPIQDEDVVRRAVQDPDWNYCSWRFSDDDALDVNKLEKMGLKGDDVLRFNELARRATELPQLRMFRKLTSAEMEDVDFAYTRAVVFDVVETKNGKVMLCPGTKPVFSERIFTDCLFMSDDYLKARSDIYPVIVEGGQLNAKWKRAFEDYKKIVNAVKGMNRINNLCYSYTIVSEEQKRAEIIALIKEELVKAIEDLKNLPERTEL